MRKTIYDPRYERMISALRQRRRELGMSQEVVARHLGVSRSWVSKVEDGQRRLDILEVIDLCLLYRIDPVEVTRDLGKRP